MSYLYGLRGRRAGIHIGSLSCHQGRWGGDGHMPLFLGVGVRALVGCQLQQVLLKKIMPYLQEPLTCTDFLVLLGH